jgi:hypothetical protein
MLIRFPSVQCLMGATVSATVNLDVSVAIEGPLAQRLEQRTHNSLNGCFETSKVTLH